MSEQDIQSEILAAVTAVPGFLAWRANSALAVTAARQVIRANVPGCADIIGCYRGRFVAIEVKTETGRQSQQQRRFQAAVERAGGLYVVARSPSDALAALQ